MLFGPVVIRIQTQRLHVQVWIDSGLSSLIRGGEGWILKRSFIVVQPSPTAGLSLGLRLVLRLLPAQIFQPSRPLHRRRKTAATCGAGKRALRAAVVACAIASSHLTELEAGAAPPPTDRRLPPARSDDQRLALRPALVKLAPWECSRDKLVPRRACIHQQEFLLTRVNSGPRP